MPDLSIENAGTRTRAVPVAMILFALVAVLVGGGDPRGSAPPPQALTPDQLELARANHTFGFPAPPQPANPPLSAGA